MIHDPGPDDEFSRLMRRIVLRHTFDPAEPSDGSVRRPRRRPRRTPSAPERQEFKWEPFNAAEAFSIVKAKKRQRQANASRKGISPRPTAQLGWNRGTDTMIREVLREHKRKGRE